MSDDDLKATIKEIAKAVRAANKSKVDPIRCCIVSVPGHQQICLPNVKFKAECNQIGRLLENAGYPGASARPEEKAGCNASDHAVIRTPRPAKARHKP